MGQIEREIKILNVDVNKVKDILSINGIKPKGKYIQDVYTFDLPSIDVLYKRYVDIFTKEKDKRGLTKLILEIRPCFSEEDLEIINNSLGVRDILDYIEDKSNDFNKLYSEDIIELMKKTNENFSKWVRLRKTGDQTTITIKKIISSKGIYELDDVDELEFTIPSLEYGKQFLEDLGYFFERHQVKMRIAYDYKNTEIVIDKWPKLDPYIEVEGPSKEEIDEAVLMLGYTLDDAKVINTDDLYNDVGINVYSKEYSDLSFNEKEKAEVDEYMK